MSSPTPKVILITGASAGIGRSCAIALSKAFSPLVLILSGRREAELQTTAKECKEGTTTEVCAGDVSNEEDVTKMFEIIREKYGRLDVVFNVSPPRRVKGLTMSPLHCLNPLIALMLRPDRTLVWIYSIQYRSKTQIWPNSGK